MASVKKVHDFWIRLEKWGKETLRAGIMTWGRAQIHVVPPVDLKVCIDIGKIIFRMFTFELNSYFKTSFSISILFLIAFCFLSHTLKQDYIYIYIILKMLLLFHHS